MYFSVKGLSGLIYESKVPVKTNQTIQVRNYGTGQIQQLVIDNVNNDLESFFDTEMFLYDSANKKTFSIYTNKLIPSIFGNNYNYDFYCIDSNLQLVKPSNITFDTIYKKEFINNNLNCKIVFQK